MSATLPATAIVTGEYRALTLYDTVPPGCGSVLVPEDAFAPHLRPGELAVIDPEDNEPVAGEIYVVTISSPHELDGIKLDFVQLRPAMLRFEDETALGWWMHFSLHCTGPPKGYRTIEEALRYPSSLPLCDGPMTTPDMRRKIVGRVIGVLAEA